jgi:hypothetical protein
MGIGFSPKAGSGPGQIWILMIYHIPAVFIKRMEIFFKLSRRKLSPRDVNLEQVPGDCSITRNRLRGPQLLNISNRLRNRVPRLIEIYQGETSYPDRQ